MKIASLEVRSPDTSCFPRAAGEPRRIGLANADVIAYESVLSLPRGQPAAESERIYFFQHRIRLCKKFNMF